MKKLGLMILIGLLVLGLTSGMAKALPWDVDNSVTISLSNSVSADPASKWSDIGGWGGLFTVTDTTSGVSIKTFCLELDEFISTSQTYYVADVSDDIVWKGGRNTDSGDEISDATKWLYVQYLQGNESYQNVQALQIAIWVLEDEYYNKSDFSWNDWDTIGTVALDYYNTAQGKSTTANIRALDLIDGQGNPVQSYIIGVPEPGTLILLGLGLIGIGFGVRWREKIA